MKFKVNGTQGEVILLLGIYAINKGISLLKNEDSPAPRTLKYTWEHYLPFTNNIFWGICWIVTALFCLIFAFRWDDRPALVALGALLGAWTFAYAIDWVISRFTDIIGSVNLTSFLLYFVLFVMIIRWHGRRSSELKKRQIDGAE